jgi:hypothetical protein
MVARVFTCNESPGKYWLAPVEAGEHKLGRTAVILSCTRRSTRCHSPLDVEGEARGSAGLPPGVVRLGQGATCSWELPMPGGMNGGKVMNEPTVPV